MKQTIFFLFLFMLPLASAIECSSLSTHQDICEYIQSSNATQEEQDYLISDIIDDLKNFPSHDFVRNWNLNVDTSQPPYDVQFQNHGFIKNVWVKILTIMPSVVEEDILYTPSNGEVLSAFNYDIEYPNEPYGNDCRTEYTTRSQEEILRLYVNGQYQDEGRLASYTTNSDSTFRTDYEITVWTEIEHYEWEDHCVERDEGRCIEWEERCEFDYREHEVDRLTISDSLEAKYYNPQTTANFENLDAYSGTIKGNLKSEETTSTHLTFTNSYFKEYDYLYSLVWKIEPYNILTVKAEPYKRTDFENLFYDLANDYTIWVSGSNICLLQYYNHFEEFTKNCGLQHALLDIQIETDKLFYNEGEEIKVTITPSNHTFNVTYAEQTHEVQGEITLKTQIPYNKISISYNGRNYDKIIHVKNNSFHILFFIIIFVGLNYVLIQVVRKTWGVALD